MTSKVEDNKSSGEPLPLWKAAGLSIVLSALVGLGALIVALLLPNGFSSPVPFVITLAGGVTPFIFLKNNDGKPAYAVAVAVMALVSLVLWYGLYASLGLAPR